MPLADSIPLESTNLHLGNLSPKVNEAFLCQEFGRFGPIASVKVMWPRTAEERERGINTGFVSFMNRVDAAEAMASVNNTPFYGIPVTVGWGKQIILPDRPIYVHTPSSCGGSAGSTNFMRGIRLPLGAQITNWDRRESVIRVREPEDAGKRALITFTAQEVLRNGLAFERTLKTKERERGGQEFAFLWDGYSSERAFYLYEYARLYLKAVPEQLFDCGPKWIPPTSVVQEVCRLADSNVSTFASFDASEADEIGPYSSKDKDKCESSNVQCATLARLLELVSTKTGEIGCSMAYCIKRADNAQALSETLIASLLLPKTEATRKLARFYVLHDILHNCASAKGGWVFRKVFEESMDRVLVHFAHYCSKLGNRLQAENFKNSVLAVFDSWTSWSFFSEHFVQTRCREPFLGTLKSAKGRMSEKLKAPPNLDGVPLLISEGRERGSSVLVCNPFYPDTKVSCELDLKSDQPA